MATTAVSRITCANAETYECSKHSGGMESLICFFVGSRSFGKTAATSVACSAVMSGLPQRLGRDEVRKSSCFGGCWPPLPIVLECEDARMREADRCGRVLPLKMLARSRLLQRSSRGRRDSY